MMDSESYLTHLNSRLTAGLARLSHECRARHVGFLRATQNPDGGFSGREGGSDLYYTGFALRGLAVLNGLTPGIAERAAGFLHRSLTQQASVVDFFSLLYSCLLVQAGGGPDVLADSPADWPERVAALLETFRTPDGGYAKTPGTSGSTYHTFLVALCYQLLGRGLPQAEEVVQFIQSRRRDDGGFVEIAPMRRGGTNPTAAAIGVLQIAEALDPAIGSGVADFLAGLQGAEGGFQANARAPLADLLSTFTAVWTLEQLGTLDRIDTDAARRYAESLDQPTGGFHGGLWDDRSDVEYTFYGLGVLGLLSERRGLSPPESA